MKMHWAKQSYHDIIPGKFKAYYNLFTACGLNSLWVDSTHMKSKVTCKNCLKAINAIKYNNKTY